MHPLLKKQLTTLKYDDELSAEMAEFIEVVNQTYYELEKSTQKQDNRYKKLIQNLERKNEYYFYIFYPKTSVYEFISSNTKLLGYDEKTLFQNFPEYLENFEQKLEEIRRLRALLFEQKQDISFEIALYDKKKKLHYFQVTEMPILSDKNQEVEAIEGVVRDITKEKYEKEKILQIAKHDTLTKLLNRLGLEENLKKLVAYSKRYEKKFALVFLDLDRFKQVNDTYGHNVGDKLLQEVAKRISSTIREEDLIARLGGDEFVVVLTNLEAKNAFFSITKKLLKILSTDWVVDGVKLDVSASMGVAIYPDDTSSLLDLFHFADVAMYNSKENGRGRITYYREKLNQKISKDLLLEKELPYAIEENQLELYYQPIYKDTKDNLFGCEALLRWRHPEYGLLLPNEFLPLAEQSNISASIDRWVIKQAIQDIKLFKQNGICTHEAKVSLNITANEIAEESFFEFLQSELATNGINPENIAIEIINYATVKEYDKLKKQLQKLKQHGIDSYIGDFDINLSALSAIETLPISTVKIEKDIISKLTCKESELIYSEIISTVCKHLSKDIIIEGVEKKEHSNYLEQAGCNKFQGYLYSRPLNTKEFIALHKKK